MEWSASAHSRRGPRNGNNMGGEGSLGYDINDCEYGIALTAEGPQSFCWIAAEGQKELGNTPMSFPLAIKRVSETVTNYELAIPWKYLPRLKPEKGRAFGFNFTVLDGDIPGAGASYWMQLTPGTVGGKDPSRYKTFVLF